MASGKKSDIVSLNQGLFSLEAGNLSVESLDQRLELAIGIFFDPFHCESFTCGTFDTCPVFTCDTFSIKVPENDG